MNMNFSIIVDFCAIDKKKIPVGLKFGQYLVIEDNGIKKFLDTTTMKIVKSEEISTNSKLSDFGKDLWDAVTMPLGNLAIGKCFVFPSDTRSVYVILKNNYNHNHYDVLNVEVKNSIVTVENTYIYKEAMVIPIKLVEIDIK